MRCTSVKGLLCVAFILEFLLTAHEAALFTQQWFYQPNSCALGGHVSNSTTLTADASECVLWCSFYAWCAAVLVSAGDGSRNCSLMNLELYYGAWYGTDVTCPPGLFARDSAVNAAVIRQPLSDCKQSSFRNGGSCSKAIDYKVDRNVGYGVCSETAGSVYNWWKANLVRRAYVDHVMLYTRQNYESRLRNFTISINGVVCASYLNMSRFAIKTFSCRAIGRLVQIDQYQNPQQSLSICEVIA